jgi:hypothetical protein
MQEKKTVREEADVFGMRDPKIAHLIKNCASPMMDNSDFSFIRLGPRLDISDLSRGRTVLSTSIDGTIAEDDHRQGLYVYETRRLSKYRWLLNQASCENNHNARKANAGCSGSAKGSRSCQVQKRGWRPVTGSDGLNPNAGSPNLPPRRVCCTARTTIDRSCAAV